MNTILVYFLMLKPALIASIFLIGIPVLLGTWLFPYLRAYLRRKQPVNARVHHGGDRRTVRDRRQDHTGIGGGRRAMPA